MYLKIKYWLLIWLEITLLIRSFLKGMSKNNVSILEHAKNSSNTPLPDVNGKYLLSKDPYQFS